MATEAEALRLDLANAREDRERLSKLSSDRQMLLETLKALRPQLLADIGARGGLTEFSRKRCLAIVKRAIAEAEARDAA